MNSTIEKYCHVKLDLFVKYSEIFTIAKELSFNEATTRYDLEFILESENVEQLVEWGIGCNGTWYWISNFVIGSPGARLEKSGQLNMKELEYLLNIRNKRLIRKLPTLIFENFIEEMKKCNNTPITAWRNG